MHECGTVVQDLLERHGYLVSEPEDLKDIEPGED